MVNFMSGGRSRRPSSFRYYQDGPPVEVNMATYRLRVSGLGVSDIYLDASALASIPRLTQSRRMVCVCNWSIRELWGGFLVRSLLEYIGWDELAKGRYLKQVSIGTADKGIYDSTIPLSGLLERDALIVDQINGSPLPMERGYPFRLIDFGLYGYKSVKGLAHLLITDQLKLGVWERKAGYTVEGTIRPKRYRICDLDDHRFVERPGEVTEF